MVVAAHVVVAGEPVGVVVDALARAVGGLRAGFAAWRDVAGEFALFYGVDRNRQVDQHPVEEIDARQRGGNAAPFLIDIVALARHVGVVADDGEGARAGGKVGPGQLRVEVPAQTDVVGGIGNAEGKLAGNSLPVGKARAGQFHWMVLLPVRRLAA